MLDLSNKISLYNIYPKIKPNGKKRIIFSPCKELKVEQKKLAKKLASFVVSDHCYGFKKNTNILDAVQLHVKKDWIITLDIKNFFPSVKKDMLIFLNDYEKEIATFNDRLVQGSPCSPVITNILFKDLDDQFYDYFKSFNVNFCRYADDYVISGYDRYSIVYIEYIKDHLSSLGFALNRKKIKIMLKNSRQEVLGIGVNDFPSINKRIRKRLRAKIHHNNLTIADKGTMSFIRSINVMQYNVLGLGC